MQLLNDTIKNPSGWDSLNNYMGESNFPDFYTVLTQNRDSDSLTRSNFISALKLLKGENKNVQIFRFNHWACGWWEVIAIKNNTEQYKIALKIEKEINDYPVLNEDHYSELRWSEAEEFWNSLSLQEKIELCKEYNLSIFSARYDYIPKNDGSLDEYLMD